MKIKKATLGNNRGSVMLIVVMIIIIISIISLLVFAASQYNSKLSSNERHRKRAFYIAESGAMMAIDSLNQNGQIKGVIWTNKATEGGTYSVEIFDSSNFAWLSWDERMIRSVGVSRNAVRRLEYIVKYATLGFADIPGPLYIEAPSPQFSGEVFTVQGGDHHFGDAFYNIPVPPGDHRKAIHTVHDSASFVSALGTHDDQVFTVDAAGNYILGSVQPNYDTLDLEALAEAYAGKTGELADTTGWIIGAFPNDYKVSYLDGDFTVAGSGSAASGGALNTCPNCGGIGSVRCWGCAGTGYEWIRKDCTACGGVGKYGCVTCDSLGYFSCPNCGGTGGYPMECEECDTCLGSGVYGCQICSGTGICPICLGSGISKAAGSNIWSCYRCGTGGKNDPAGTGICPTCSGVGGIPCPFCAGTGIDPATGCATCGGTGVLDCPDCVLGLRTCSVCGGTGGIGVDRICYICGGSGTQLCPWCLGTGLIGSKGGGHGAKGTIGAGVLVVTGNLHISGQFEFTGLIIVLGEVSVDITGGGQGVHIWGSLLCKSIDFKIAGNADVVWCSQALRNLPNRPAGFKVKSVTEY